MREGDPSSTFAWPWAESRTSRGEHSKPNVSCAGSRRRTTLFSAAAAAEMAAAKPLRHNGYKVELGRRLIVRALQTALAIDERTTRQKTMATGWPHERADAALKVTGSAKYTADFAPGMAYAVLVTSKIAKGRIAHLDVAAAEASEGVIQVY